jgi:hypothetical protein
MRGSCCPDESCAVLCFDAMMTLPSLDVSFHSLGVAALLSVDGLDDTRGGVAPARGSMMGMGL